MKDLNELLKALYEDDREKEISLTKNRNPLQVRDLYGRELGSHVRNNYDIFDPAVMSLEDEQMYADLLEAGHKKPRPLGTPNFNRIKQLFSDSHNIKDTKIVEDGFLLNKLNARAAYNPSSDTVSMSPNSFTDKYKLDEDVSDLLHELKHGTDFQGVKSETDKHLIKSMFDTNVSKDLNSNKLGLSNAENTLENHHITDSIFERGGLQRLLKGGKLGLVLPVLKAAGVAAIGHQVLGIGNKAMAGDLGPAGMEAADLATNFIPGIGEAKDALASEELGAGEDKLLAQVKNQQVMNDPEERRFSKIKALMSK